MGAGGALHEQLVADVVARHGAQTRGFKAAVRAIDTDLVDGYMPTPDAWRIDEDGSGTRVRVWEVDVGHPLGLEQLLAYGWLAGDLDCVSADLSLDLRAVDRFGQEREINTMDWYFRALGRAARRMAEPA
jgi:hypothetical protein